MARESIIQRERKRERMVAKYAAKRQALKGIINDPKVTDEERWEARMKLQALPRDASPVRLQRRCSETGRPRGVYKKFGLSRNKLRKYAMQGLVPGITKASW